MNIGINIVDPVIQPGKGQRFLTRRTRRGDRVGGKPNITHLDIKTLA